MPAKSNISIQDISAADLRDVDLNLLVTFVALMDTRSVTRAAERLRVGQPSASHALKRLRDLVGDPLFTRGPMGMVPTPRALALDEPVRAILSDIMVALSSSEAFTPANAHRNFRIGATDYAQVAIAEPLLARLAVESPGSRLLLTNTDCDSVGRSLERGDIDLAFGAFPQLSWAAHQQHLYDETYACVFDAAACGIDGTITFEQWLALPHAIMSTKGDYAGPLDAVLAKQGLARQVAVSTPSFLALPYLLRGKAMVAALPTRLAERCASLHGLTLSPMPFDAPSFAVSMIWTARTDGEAGLAWLRSIIATVCSTECRPLQRFKRATSRALLTSPPQ